MNWLDIKNEAARLLFEKDALHIYAAVIIQLVAAQLSRKSLGHWLPWSAVLGLELCNELLDVVLGQEPTLKAWQLVGAAHDLFNTMIMPTLLLVLCRRAPDLWNWEPPTASSAQPPDVSAQP